MPQTFFIYFMLLFCCPTIANGRPCSDSLCLPDGYNKMDFPNSEGPGPVVVNTTIFLIDMLQLHSETFTLDLSLYIIFEWKDDRMKLNQSKGTVDLGQSFIDHIWRPSLYIWNMNGERSYQSKLTMESMRIIKNPDKTTLVYSTEIHVGVVWPMDYSRFPFDTNECEFRLSSYTYQNVKKLLFRTEGSRPPDSHLETKKIRNYSIKLRYFTEVESVVPSWDEQGVNESNAGFKITLATKPEKYLLVYHLPASMFTLTSWFSFLLPPTAYPARTGLLVTVFLCQIGIFNAVIRNTPNANGGRLYLQKCNPAKIC